jgi:integrase
MPASARKFVTWKGRKIPLVLERGIWRLRSRTRFLQVDLSTGTSNETMARTLARDLLEAGAAVEKERKTAGNATLQDLVDAYKATPKRVAERTAASNISRLIAIVRLVHGTELAGVKVRAVTSEFWTAYQAARYKALGRPLDYTRRIPENAGINAAVRGARSLFIRRLRPAYERAGIHLPADADVVTWLPEPALLRPEADDASMVAAWEQMPRDALWLTVGLARFAGLRMSEIAACRRSWVTEAGAIDLRDRPEDGFQSKTGRPYLAPVLHPALAAALLAAPAGLIVAPKDPGRVRWLYRGPQQWARQFVGTARKPMHRLRGLYASDLAERTRNAVAAQLAGEQAAASALGHTTPETTRRHYL